MHVEDWGCAEHWRVLPRDLREAFVRGQPMAAANISSWITATFAVSGTSEKWDPGRWERLKRMVAEKDEARRLRREQLARGDTHDDG